MKAHELLDSPKKWTTGVAARNEFGKHIYAVSPDACQFCIYGAILRCYGSFTNKEINDRLLIESPTMTKLLSHLNFKSTHELFNWNNTNNFETIHETLLRLDI